MHQNILLSETSRSGVGELRGCKCNQGPEVAVLGLKLNWVMKLTWRGERMMSDFNVIAVPWVLLAIEQADFFFYQLLRYMFLFPSSFWHCWFGFEHKLFSACFDCQGHFMTEGFSGSANTTYFQPCPNLGSQMCFRISYILDRWTCAHSECFLHPPMEHGTILLQYFCSRTLKFSFWVG